MMRALVVMVAVVVTEQTGAMEAGVQARMANAPLPISRLEKAVMVVMVDAVDTAREPAVVRPSQS